MTGERPDELAELVERRDKLAQLQKAIESRLANLDEVEKLKAEALSLRALNPNCQFDRKHREQLYKLALFPDEVGWIFRLQNWLHEAFAHKL